MLGSIGLSTKSLAFLHPIKSPNLGKNFLAKAVDPGATAFHANVPAKSSYCDKVSPTLPKFCNTGFVDLLPILESAPPKIPGSVAKSTAKPPTVGRKPLRSSSVTIALGSILV